MPNSANSVSASRKVSWPTECSTSHKTGNTAPKQPARSPLADIPPCLQPMANAIVNARIANIRTNGTISTADGHLAGCVVSNNTASTSEQAPMILAVFFIPILWHEILREQAPQYIAFYVCIEAGG